MADTRAVRPLTGADIVGWLVRVQIQATQETPRAVVEAVGAVTRLLIDFSRMLPPFDASIQGASVVQWASVGPQLHLFLL